jgi:predicted nucleic-acid-binding Zn-ribbon protein
MSLTPTQMETAVRWFQEKLMQSTCSACGQSAGFVVGGLIATPIVSITDQGLVNETEISAPFIPLSCKNCGYTRLFSALVLNLIPQSAQLPS